MGLLNKIGGLVGLGGGQGEHYRADPFKSKGQEALKKQITADNSNEVRDAILGLQSGDMSLEEALASLGGHQERIAALASSPIGGSLVASEMVREDPLSAGLLGEDGSLERALSEEKELAGRGFSLQPEDYEAYGQASGNIARMFGKQEQSLAEALANRGLAAGGGGSAVKAMSGIMGNKNERLGQLQRQIADDRMEKNLQRLEQTRSFAARLGDLGQQSLAAAFSRNMAGAERRTDSASRLAGTELSAYEAAQRAKQAEQASKEANRELGLSDALSGGIYKGVQGGVSSGIGYGTGSIFGLNKFPTNVGSGRSFDDKKPMTVAGQNEKKRLGSMF